MRSITLISFFLLSSIICNADFKPLILPQLIVKADLIIHARITDVLEEKFEVNIKEVFKGKSLSRNLTINKFKDWACATRWTTYEIGQEELIFLIRDEISGDWEIIGAGNEGEMPIADGFLYYKSHFRNRYFTSERILLMSSNKIYGTKYKMKEVINGIKLYLSEIENLRKMMEDKSIIDFCPPNSFFQRIVDEKIISNRYIFTAIELAKRGFHN